MKKRPRSILLRGSFFAEKPNLLRVIQSYPHFVACHGRNTCFWAMGRIVQGKSFSSLSMSSNILLASWGSSLNGVSSMLLGWSRTGTIFFWEFFGLISKAAYACW